MKTTKFFKTTLLALFGMCLLMFITTSIGAKTSAPIVAGKTKISPAITKTMIPIRVVKKSLSKAMMQQWYFEFYDEYGNLNEVKGYGTADSGSISSFVGICYFGTYMTSGTCSGSYEVSDGVATISVEVSLTGYYTDMPYPWRAGQVGSVTDQSGTEINLTCND